MFVIYRAVSIFIRIVDVLILTRILLSFFPDFRMSKVSEIVYIMTEPILAPCRALLERIGLGTGVVDFSPILAFLLLRFIQYIVYLL